MGKSIRLKWVKTAEGDEGIEMVGEIRYPVARRSVIASHKRKLKKVVFSNKIDSAG